MEYRVTDGHEVLGALLYASTTDGAIDWGRLPARLAGLPAITSLDRVELFLRAVNGDRLTMKEWRQLVGIGTSQFNVTFNATAPIPREPREAMRGALDRILDADLLATPDGTLGKDLAALLDGNIILIPERSATAAIGQGLYRVVARSPGDALAYALRLVVDPGEPYRQRLAKCGYAECARFALRDPPQGRGQPPRYFCPETDHREVQLRAEANERRQAKNAGVSVRTWRARRARAKKAS